MDAARGPRVLVTGASGFVGQHVTAALAASGAMVSTASVRDADSLHEAVRVSRPDGVIHLGGFTDIGASWTEPEACFDANVNGTLRLLGALRHSPCQRVVFASTADVYGDAPVPFREDGPINPASPYAVSKAAAEEVCRLARSGGGPEAVVVRLFNAYGPGQPDTRIVADVILSALRGEDVLLTQGLQRRETNYVADIAAGVVAALVAPGAAGEVINLGSGNAISIRELAERILSVMGNPVAARFGARPERPVEVPVVEADTAKARVLLGWEPRTSLDDGLRATVQWYGDRL